MLMTGTICLTMEDWVSNSMSNWVSNKSRVGNNSTVGNWGMGNNSRSILRNSIIGDILDDSISIVSILDSLDPAIRKSDSVAARCGVSVSLLLLLEVVATVVIIDSILESIESWLCKITIGCLWVSNSIALGAAEAQAARAAIMKTFMFVV
eukprot:TRINITY_DN189_c0_g2_i1.p1 TRINITY_DN189_c0_g2~~TRINITY_DN189_c0_g2_i1.p1  ORF type:complete len:151 (+),score=34.35 TRINITY_DN189_c0_g2_i1:53-505(+)